MRKYFLRTCFFFLIVSLFFCLAVSQEETQSYKRLLQQYAAAQLYYDKATALTEVEEYGPQEEALEKEWNERALKQFTLLYKSMPAGLLDSLRFHTSFKIGELQHYFENFAEAIYYYKASLQIQEKNSLPDSLFFKPYLYAGIIFYNQNKFDTAVQFFKQAEKNTGSLSEQANRRRATVQYFRRVVL